MKQTIPYATSIFLAGCVALLLIQRPPQPATPVPVNATAEPSITQVATIDSLLAGVYDGETSLEDLSRHGNFGIGTFDNLDGEMAVLDGEFFQIKADGRVYRPPMKTETPFASIVPFDESRATKILIDQPLDFEGLCKKIDETFTNNNIPIAVRVHGKFSTVRTRSVPPQQKPFKPLAEVTKTQPEFDLADVEGDVVGFRLPPYMKGLNVPGYHLHFLDRDRKVGGHILKLTIESGTAQVLSVHHFEMLLPKESKDFADTDLSRDRSRELEKVEK